MRQELFRQFFEVSTHASVRRRRPSSLPCSRSPPVSTHASVRRRLRFGIHILTVDLVSTHASVRRRRFLLCDRRSFGGFNSRLREGATPTF